MDTSVIIGAAIYALMGQVAELYGSYFPLAFLVGSGIPGFSSYAYGKMSNTNPSAGGIGMYLLMDIVIQWGVLRNLRNKVEASPYVIVIAMVLDIIVVGAFLWTKASSDRIIVIIPIVLIRLIFSGEKLFLSRLRKSSNQND